MVYAYGKENIAITGTGTLDGNAEEDHWWLSKGKKKLDGKKNNLNKAIMQIN
ncbi:hypothetical protein KFZ56_04155 [Virgibacillus sp. NKC19-3]|uniref:hypothetical protein n=1 Tax=Virgibacillus saliphilus TaxID=2831674 RepID=UPI001C9B6526|nr:hypothetical protein [Virgibacillus sp. NKC19-3]MBY7142298.1 hypothetical protein [Virgibacillus sp. NKC19-3]